MQRTIQPFIAFALLLIITFFVSLFLIRQTELANLEIDSIIPSPLMAEKEKRITVDEFFSTENNGIDTKNWKVYNDKIYGFQFRYPDDLELRISPSYSDAGGERGITLGSKNFPTERFWMSMGVFKGFANPQELYKHLIGGAAPGEVLETLETTLSGHKFYLGKETVGKMSPGGIINYTYAVSLADDTMLWIDFYGFPIDKTSKEWEYLPKGQAILQSLIIK